MSSKIGGITDLKEPIEKGKSSLLLARSPQKVAEGAAEILERRLVSALQGLLDWRLCSPTNLSGLSSRKDGERG